MLNANDKLPYSLGNVLIFADKRRVILGSELARAHDLDAAREYLDASDPKASSKTLPSTPYVAKSEHESELGLHDDTVRALTKSIEQRDELLKDLAETLKAQTQENDLLNLQLDLMREQAQADEIKQNELMCDLQNISKETQSIESTLELVLEEKFKLEQELAERITELLELNLQNGFAQPSATLPANTSESVVDGAMPAADTNTNAMQTQIPLAGPNNAIQVQAPLASANAFDKTTQTPPVPGQVFTMASGKQIHIVHEFPSAKKPSLTARIIAALLGGFKAIGIAILVIVTILAASTVATAVVNDISFGDALNHILKSLESTGSKLF